jgi:Tol biopolymer transport system component
MNIRRLTHGEGIGPAVAISPDGRYVAYAKQNWLSQTSALWLLEIATRTEVQIPEAEGSVTVGLTFSPDGNYLYMVRNEQSQWMTHHLFRTPTLGGRPQHLLMGVDTPVSFSPDGHDFAYTRDIPKRDAVELRRASAEGTNDHLIATIDGTSELYASGGAAWSPDGRTICLPVERVDKQKRWAMEVVSVSDGSFHELFSSHWFIGRPTWQPDGKSLIVGIADGPEDRLQLWKVSFPGGILRRITNDLTDYGYRPDVAADGRTMATVAWTYDSSLWSVPRSNPLAATLIHSNQQMYQVASGPDGRIFALAYDDGAPWVMNADGSHPALFTNARGARGIRVCGRFAVFLTFEEASVRVLRVNPDGSNPTEMVTGALSSLDCSSRGESVYYFDTRAPANISRVSVEGGTPAVVEKALGENWPGLISVSPDGNYLAYAYEETARQPVTHLAVIPTSGGPPVKTFEGPVVAGLVRWSPDSKHLDYIDSRSGAYNIWEQSLTGGTPKQLTNFTTDENIIDFTWSADGSALLLIRDRGSIDVVLISNFQ